MLNVQGLTVDFGDKRILDDICFSLEPGHWLMISGPNGAGKSTIVKALSQACPYKGKIVVEGKNTAKMKASDLARRLGVLSQSHNVAYSFTVREVIALGRYPYAKSMFCSETSEDTRKIDAAMGATGLTGLADRSVMELSGGELQRTFLAQLFAQDPNIIVLDEPTNNLDLVYQKQIFELIEDWLKTGNRAVISIIHDLSLVRHYGTDAILINHGKIVAAGEPKAVISDKFLTDVYSMNVVSYMRSILSSWDSVKSN